MYCLFPILQVMKGVMVLVRLSHRDQNEVTWSSGRARVRQFLAPPFDSNFVCMLMYFFNVCLLRSTLHVSLAVHLYISKLLPLKEQGTVLSDVTVDGNRVLLLYSTQNGRPRKCAWENVLVKTRPSAVLCADKCCSAVLFSIRVSNTQI